MQPSLRGRRFDSSDTEPVPACLNVFGHVRAGSVYGFMTVLMQEPEGGVQRYGARISARFSKNRTLRGC